MDLSVREVRQHLGEILDRVSAGDEVVVTRRGRPLAALVRVPGDRRGRPVGVAAHAGALARLDGLGEAIATVVSLRSVARDREPPGIG